MRLRSLYIISFSFSFCFIFITIYIKKNLKIQYNPNTKISVLIFSDIYKKSIEKILSSIVKYKNINDIILIYKNRKPIFIHPKINYIQDNRISKYSSFIRFFYLSSCKNNNILLLNNDILPTERLVMKLISHYDNDNENYYGIFQRSCSSSGYHTISIYNNIILSPIILTSKEILEKTWTQMKEKESKMKEKKMDDILFQFYFEKIYGKQPIVVKGKYRILSSSLSHFKNYKRKNEYCKDLYKNF